MLLLIAIGAGFIYGALVGLCLDLWTHRTCYRFARMIGLSRLESFRNSWHCFTTQ